MLLDKFLLYLPGRSYCTCKVSDGIIPWISISSDNKKGISIVDFIPLLELHVMYHAKCPTMKTTLLKYMGRLRFDY